MRHTKTVVVVIIVAAVVLALLVVRRPDERITLADWSWKLSGNTAPFEFRVISRVDEKLTVVVVLEAHEVDQSQVGTKLHLVGLRKLEIELAPHEEKRVTGVVDLLRFGGSSTRVSYTLSIKEHNSPDPKPPSVTSAANAGGAPAGRSVH
jgi:hypothetical protein